jgi:hypothetical protein
MIEFEINGQTYKASKLSAMAQLHLSRRLAPIIPKVLPALSAMAGKDESSIDLAEMAVALQPAADALAAMSDEDAEHIYSACLSVVQRKQDNAWRSVWSAAQKTTLFDDIELDVMTQLVFRVVGDSLGNFIRGLLSKANLQQVPTE